jgi:hypothetical protein
VAISEDYLRRAVDDVLEPAWPFERRRALRRMVCFTLVRVFRNTLLLMSFGFVAALVAGVAFPWAFGVFAFLGAVSAIPGPSDHSHLYRTTRK